MRKQMIDERAEATRGMMPLFPDLVTRPLEVVHTVKAEHLEGKARRGRPRNYAQVREMMELCKRVTYTLKKGDVQVMQMVCDTQRTAWEASKLSQELLKRRIADECTIKYQH